MPKIAILSDIHANYDALSVVLEKCREIEVDQYVSLGDIVGYNAEPLKCLEAIQALGCKAMVFGNHDYYAASGDTEASGFNRNARLAIQWTREQLSPEQRNWLIQMPEDLRLPQWSMTLVHATLDTPTNWGYVFDSHHAGNNFAYQRTVLCFCGHSHVPIAFCRKPMSLNNERSIDVIPGWNFSTVDPQFDHDFTLADELPVEYRSGGAHKYLFNVGSIGQPRNGDPRASFAVVDTAAHVVTRYRLPYNIAVAQEKILAAGLPDRLAERIALGN